MRQIVLLFSLISLLPVKEIVSGTMIKRLYQLISYLLQDKTNKTSINLLLFFDNSFITRNSKKERENSILMKPEFCQCYSSNLSIMFSLNGEGVKRIKVKLAE